MHSKRKLGCVQNQNVKVLKKKLYDAACKKKKHQRKHLRCIHTHKTYVSHSSKHCVCVCVCVSVEGEDVDNTIAALDETLSLLQHTAIALSGLANSMVVLLCRHHIFLTVQLILNSFKHIWCVCVCVCVRARACVFSRQLNVCVSVSFFYI